MRAFALFLMELGRSAAFHPSSAGAVAASLSEATPRLESSRPSQPWRSKSSANKKPAWYKLRQKSMSPAQKKAERALWPLWGLEFAYNKPIDLGTAFGREAPTVLEIGCGCGEALVELAVAYPERNFVGVDWLRRGLVQCLTAVKERNLTNVRVIRSDVGLLLERGLPLEPLFDEVKIFFPDPWYSSPERKVVRPEVVQQISRRMRPSGWLHIATDVEGYPDDVREVLKSPQLAGGKWRATAEPRRRPSTHYEREAIAAEREIEDLYFNFESLV